MPWPLVLGGIAAGIGQGINSGVTASINEKNMRWQETQARENRLYQHNEAELARNWEANMSNTAYQRATQDLQAAGLNPMLAYMQGGASTPSANQAGPVSTGSPAQFDVGATASRALEGFMNTGVSAYRASQEAKGIEAQIGKQVQETKTQEQITARAKTETAMAEISRQILEQTKNTAIKESELKERVYDYLKVHPNMNLTIKLLREAFGGSGASGAVDSLMKLGSGLR